MRTYDIINAGPENRFMANGRIVSNSGRIVQLQNLFRNSLPDLDQARGLVTAVTMMRCRFCTGMCRRCWRNASGQHLFQNRG